jgi:hypothetical protein
MSERDDKWYAWIPALVLAIVVMIVVVVISKVQTAEIRDLQRRIAVLEQWR